MSQKKIIMNCDPGIDDAIAILTALQSPEIDLLGIVSVNGNVSSKAGALNALKILTAVIRLEVPVVQGMASPLRKQAVRAENIHGKGGLGEMVLQNKGTLTQRTASDFVLSTLARYAKRSVSIVATGPLTNIAMLLGKMSLPVDDIKEICIMGGAFGLDRKVRRPVYGNITEFAEFNFYVDPGAAKKVMDSNAKIKVVGLDITENIDCEVDSTFLSKISKCTGAVAEITRSLLNFAIAKHGLFHLHDVFAVAMTERPGLFKFKKGSVDLVLDGKMRGHSVFKEEKGGTVSLAVDIDAGKFNDYLLERLS